jgi:hypothetical protein
MTHKLAVKLPPWVVQPPPGDALWRGRPRRLLLRWSRPSSLSRRQRVLTCTHCYSAVRTLSTGVRHTMATSRCSRRCWWRMVSPHHRLAGTSNLIVHDDVRAMKATGSIGSAVNQGCFPRWSRDRSPRGRGGRRQRKTAEDFENQKN